MAQAVEHLLSKCEILNSNPSPNKTEKVYNMKLMGTQCSYLILMNIILLRCVFICTHSFVCMICKKLEGFSFADLRIKI
jgi:hypothetical protein